MAVLLFGDGATPSRTAQPAISAGIRAAGRREFLRSMVRINLAALLLLILYLTFTNATPMFAYPSRSPPCPQHINSKPKTTAGNTGNTDNSGNADKATRGASQRSIDGASAEIARIAEMFRTEPSPVESSSVARLTPLSPIATIPSTGKERVWPA